MQTKNTIKQVSLLLLSLIVAEGIFGVGLYWPVILAMKNRTGIFWIVFACGLFLSSLYSQKIGPMSIFLVAVLGVATLTINNSRGLGKLILIISLILNFVFDKLFGLQWSLFEMIILVVLGLVISSDQDSQETIKINL